MSGDLQRVRQIFAEAIGKETPEACAAYLDVACEGDAELRAEVDRLIEAGSQAGDFLETSVLPPYEEPEYEGPGSVIGRYRILEQIGEGAFGLVFMAEQIEPVRRKVALKIIKAGMDTKEVIARFEAERQALALMDHPNIARVLDAGTTRTSRPYFVMELVKGIPLTDYCDRHSLSMPDRLQLFMQVCHAVQHAHQKAIIHRDLKPSNILVTLIDGEPVPKIIDFGVAKALGQQLTEKTLFTAFAQIIGTPAYMSPEQAALSGVDVDTRSDIYSLGVLLYELLAGVTPFDAETLRRAGLDEIRRMIRETEPPKPSTRLRNLGDKVNEVAQHRHTEPSTLSRQLHGDLDWIVMRCLEKERARRYETANALELDLRRHLDHRPVVAGPPGTGYRLRKFVRRHRVGVALIATAWAALMAGLSVALIGFVHAIEQRDRAVIAEVQAEALARQESEQRQRAEANLRIAQINQIQHHLDKGEVGPALVLLEEQRATVNMQDSRSLEWRHLWWRAHQGHRFTLRGHRATVLSVAFTPDGNQVVSGSEDGTVRLWSTTNGLEQTTIARLPRWAFMVAVSPDGKTLAWADNVDGVALWDLPGRRLRHAIRTSRVTSLSFSPDSRFLAGGCMDGSMRIWNVDSGEPVGPTLRSERGQVLRVAFKPNGQTLACANLEGSFVTFLDVNDLEVRTQSRRHRNWIRALAFSADGNTLVSSDLNTVKLWDVAESREKAEFIPAVSMPTRFALSRNGEWIAVGGRCGTIEVRELASGKARFFGHLKQVRSLAFSPDDRTLASAGVDGTIKLWDFRQERDLPPLQENLGSISSVAYSPDGSLLAVAGQRSSINLELREGSSGRLLRAIATPNSRFVVFSPDGRVVAFGPAQLWDVEAERKLPSLSGDGLAAAFSPDGETLAIGGPEGAEGIVRLWKWRTGEKLVELHGHSEIVRSVAISPDGRTLASASGNGYPLEIILWDIRSGQRKHTLRHGCSPVAYSPDGALLASGTWNGGIALWDPDTGRLLKDIMGHVRFAGRLAFAPDGKTILSGNVQGGVSLWDVEKGIERATLSKRDHEGTSIAVSPDGKTFVTGDSNSGTLAIWRTASESEVRAQSVWFDPRFGLARKHYADAYILLNGSNPEDALRAYTRADRFYRELEAEFPDRTEYQAWMLANKQALAPILLAHGERKEMEKVCRELVELNDVGTLNNLAWRFATSPDPNQRDGPWAVTLAEQAVTATDRTNANYLDTLAAAYAEAGQFTDAVRVQKEAIALLESPETIKDFESRLRLFESDSPFRQP